MGDDSSHLLRDGSTNNKKKKKQKMAIMLLDELDNNQQRNCLVAAAVARVFSPTNDISIIIGHWCNCLDAHYEVIVNKIVNLKENKPNLFT